VAIIVASPFTRTTGLVSASRGTAMSSVFPSRRAQRRTGSCGVGVDLTTQAARRSGCPARPRRQPPRRRSFGIRPRSGNTGDALILKRAPDPLANPLLVLHRHSPSAPRSVSATAGRLPTSRASARPPAACRHGRRAAHLATGGAQREARRRGFEALTLTVCRSAWTRSTTATPGERRSRAPADVARPREHLERAPRPRTACRGSHRAPGAHPFRAARDAARSRILRIAIVAVRADETAPAGPSQRSVVWPGRHHARAGAAGVRPWRRITSATAPKSGGPSVARTSAISRK
jgi:hypothetical protein